MSGVQVFVRLCVCVSVRLRGCVSLSLSVCVPLCLCLYTGVYRCVCVSVYRCVLSPCVCVTKWPQKGTTAEVRSPPGCHKLPSLFIGAAESSLIEWIPKADGVLPASFRAVRTPMCGKPPTNKHARLVLCCWSPL